MMEFDDANISTESKSNEQNIQIIKSYLNELVSQISYEFNQLEERIKKLEKETYDGNK